MSFIPMNLPVRRAAAPRTPEWKVRQIAGGINYEDIEYQLADDQSPYALNVWYHNRILGKRWGYKQTNNTPTEPILTAYPYKFLGYFIFAAGTKLYRYDPATGTATMIFSGLTQQKGSFFKYNGKLYYINGANYVAWDGSSCTAVVPYIPTVVINRTPTGGGSVNQDYNRLGAGIRNSFNGTGAATAYTLTDANLDATAVTATVNGAAMVENTDFTVNRATGIVTFSVAPASGTNNVLITFYKTVQATINTILTCTRAIAFGGQNDNRIFFGGNGTPYIYWSGVTDPTYIPITQYNIIGANDDAVTCFGVQYDVLVVFKGRQMGAVTYQYDIASGKAYFPYYNINGAIGCDAPDTLQLIDNRLTWMNSYGGVHTLIGTQVKEQKDVQQISRNINGNSKRSGLLMEAGLASAIAYCFANKYWLCVGSKVYIWDYGAKPYIYSGSPEADAARLGWWVFDNIAATAFLDDGTSLYFTDANGYVQQFVNSYADNGAAINAYWKMAIRDFGVPEWEKTVQQVFITSQTQTNMQMGIMYYSDRSAAGIPGNQIVTVSTFNLAHFNLAAFSLGVINIARTFAQKINMRGIVYFALMASNNVVNQDMNISDIKVIFNLNRLVR